MGRQRCGGAKTCVRGSVSLGVVRDRQVGCRRGRVGGLGGELNGVAGKGLDG